MNGDDVLPDRPRLRSNICVFDAGDELVIRSVAGAFRIDPVHRALMSRILPRLDGTHDFYELLSGESTNEAFYALRMLASFAESGLLADGPSEVKTAFTEPSLPLPGLTGVNLVRLDNGLFSSALCRSFQSLGANVYDGDLALARPSKAIAFACPDGPDLASLESTNIAAVANAIPWLPVFPFGDGIIIGPLFRPQASPCLRCFELRWLGISPSIALEVAYFAHLRKAFRNRATLTETDTARLAALVTPIAASRLVNSAAAASIALVQFDSGLTTQARLDPCPHCDVCSGPPLRDAESGSEPTEVKWNDSPVPLCELGPDLESAAGHPCGLASIVPPPNHIKNAPPPVLEITVARFAIPDPEDVTGAQENFCHGAAPTREEARAVAIIESMERYNGLSRPAAGIWRSYASIASDSLLPTKLPLFSDAEYSCPEFPFQPFDPERTLRWNWGYNFTLKRHILVPTSAAWYGYDDTLLGESSNGVAAHSSRGHALLNGVLEVVERDAFMIHWLNCLSPPHLNLDGITDDKTRAITSCVQESGYSLHVLDLTTDLEIPVVLALGTREDGRKPALILGAGASLDYKAALSRALSELYAATLAPTELWALKSPLDQKDVTQLADHSRAYEHPNWLQHACFLWASNQHVSRHTQAQSAPSWHDSLSLLIERLAVHDHDIVGVDITGADVARHRLFVVRAIVPGLQPLALGSKRRLGGRRVYEAPIRMGYRNAVTQEKDLNPVPHCFP